VGFEPNPICVFYLYHLIQENTALISSENTFVVPIGLYAKEEVGRLRITGIDSGSSGAYLHELFRDRRESHTHFVPLMRYATVERTIGCLDVGIVKIDVEGSEYEVLIGLDTLIKRDEPIIIIEILPVYDRSNTYRLERQELVQSFLRDCGYKIYRIIKNPDGSLRTFQPINEIAIHSDLAACDYVCVLGSHGLELSSLSA
jgi:FkbM family methyltransferase